MVILKISAGDVKALREKTGAGMLECKNALEQCFGDSDRAEKLLKEKGLAAVEKRAGRATNEGRVFVKAAGDTAVLAELASETDFVARNQDFIALGEAIVSKALEKGYTAVNDELSGMVAGLAAKIKENMSLKRLGVLKAGSGEYIARYIHGDGAIGVAVSVAADKPEVFGGEEAKAFAFNLAMHIAAFNPMVLDRSRLDPAWVKEQESIFRAGLEQDEKMKGKPANVIDNILKGKVNKLLQDVCLLDQPYIKDEKLTVAKAIEEAGRKAGAKLSVTHYLYFKVGA
jgi:elongation factor Ts